MASTCGAHKPSLASGGMAADGRAASPLPAAHSASVSGRWKAKTGGARFGVQRVGEIGFDAGAFVAERQRLVGPPGVHGWF